MKPFLHLSIVASLVAVLFISTGVAHASGTTITVNTIDGGSTSGDGFCSLQEAVAAANTDTAQDSGACPAGFGTDTIAFNLPGPSYTITLTSSLQINTPVILDGTTQPGSGSTPLVRIDGNNASMWGVGFYYGSDGSTVKDLMFTRFGYGNLIVSNSTGTKVIGNYIGTDGSSALGGNDGLVLEGATNAIIGGPTTAERNVIAGNTYDIMTHSNTTGASIRGNYIGVFADGATSPSGSSYGIILSITSAANSGSSSNTVGGPAAGEGNVIAGHNTAEIGVWSDDQSFSDFNYIQGNIIGLTAAGNALATYQAGDGIDVVNSDNTNIIDNTISGKTGAGIKVFLDATLHNGPGSPVAPTGTGIQSNRIGTSADGLSALGNGTGILVNNATNTVIGGVGVISNRNLISANTTGIEVDAGTGTFIDTNVLGMNLTNTAHLANTTTGMSIGASVEIAQNWVAGSATGILVSGSGAISTPSNNCLTGNTSFGLNNTTASPVTFSGAWWGASNGPSGSASGSGDAVSGNVVYAPFYNAAPAICGSGVFLDVLSLPFGSQLVGSTSSLQTVTVTAAGLLPLLLTSITVQAPYHLDATGTCPLGSGSLAIGASCTIKVKFSPFALGSTPSSLLISSDALGSPTIIGITGTGVAGTQLLKNPSFETDANHDKKPDAWSFANFNPLTDKRDCTVRQSGKCSLELVGNGKTKTATQTITKSGLAGDDFAFSLFSKALKVPAAATYQLTVTFYNGVNIIGTQVLNFTKGTHTFKKVTGSFVAPGPYTKVVYRITYKAVSGIVWFDNDSLTWAP